MRPSSGPIGRFRKDERGVFAVVFGLMAIVLVAFAGAVVDFVTLQQTRTAAQVALDAATLALQPEIFENRLTRDQIRARAQALINERIGDPRITATVDDIAVDVTEGSLILYASLGVPTTFVQLVGVPELRAGLMAEATRKKLALEVVMVLDNSTSMAQQSRMTHLKTAATCAVNVIFGSQTCSAPSAAAKQDNVRIALVPFTNLVNVGTGNRTEAWLDWAGRAPISKENFDNDDNEGTRYTGNPNRTDLFAAMRTSWGGCVIAREAPHDVSDTPPSISDPATLFTPYFAPDEPPGYSNNYILDDTPPNCTVRTCTWTETRTVTTTGGRNPTTTYGQWTTQSRIRRIGNQTTNVSSCSGLLLSTSYNTGNANTATQRVRVYSLLTERELQERLCKYHTTTPVTSFSSSRGPNFNCPSVAILPLTNNDATVRSRISAMSANGYTNIQQGAIWGFHVLSPGVPFTEGDVYDTATSKVMILMTDGENYNDWQNYNNNINGNSYGAHGYRWNGHLSGGNNTELIAAMNTKTVDTCTNAKAAGIVVYTIGLSSPNNSTTTMLRDCATGPDYAFFPNNPSDLTSIFRRIADQLTRLRLAQ